MSDIILSPEQEVALAETLARFDVADALRDTNLCPICFAMMQSEANGAKCLKGHFARFGVSASVSD